MFASICYSSDLMHSAGKFIRTRQEEREQNKIHLPSSHTPATYFTPRKTSSHKTVSKEASNRCTLVSFLLRHAERRVDGILEGVSKLRMLKSQVQFGFAVVIGILLARGDGFAFGRGLRRVLSFSSYQSSSEPPISSYTS